jgi:hypothetical protein
VLNLFAPATPVPGKCALGRLSAYHVQAQSAGDVSKTLGFLQHYGIGVSIKSTGHDYFGRSNAAKSLAIWTYNVKHIGYHRAFQPQNCQTCYEYGGEIGACIQAQEMWEYLEPLNIMVTVGAAGSVSIAGGFGRGGGHRPLGPSYSLMVDQAVEFMW